MKPSQRFAINQWLTDYPDNMTYEQILDAMMGDEEEWTHDAITAWHVVEHFTLRQVAQFIEDTQKHFAAVTNEEK